MKALQFDWLLAAPCRFLLPARETRSWRCFRLMTLRARVGMDRLRRLKNLLVETFKQSRANIWYNYAECSSWLIPCLEVIPINVPDRRGRERGSLTQTWVGTDSTTSRPLVWSAARPWQKRLSGHDAHDWWLLELFTSDFDRNSGRQSVKLLCLY